MLYLEKENGFQRTSIKNGDRLLFYKKIGVLKIVRGVTTLLFSKDVFDNEIYHPYLKQCVFCKFVAEIIAETNGLRAVDATTEHMLINHTEVFRLAKTVRSSYKRDLYDFFISIKSATAK